MRTTTTNIPIYCFAILFIKLINHSMPAKHLGLIMSYYHREESNCTIKFQNNK